MITSAQGERAEGMRKSQNYGKLRKYWNMESINTPPKIGIFDPGFDFVGHWVAFNGYIAGLLGDDFQVVFLDVGGRMRDAYENKVHFKYPPAFITVAEVPVYPGKLSLKSIFAISWWQRRLADLLWWRRAFEEVRKVNLDMVVITSQISPFLYLQNPQFPFCIVVGPSALMEGKAGLKGLSVLLSPLYNFFIRKYLIFLGKAKVVFTPNEPTIPLAFRPTVWMPLSLKEFKPEKTVPGESS